MYLAIEIVMCLMYLATEIVFMVRPLGVGQHLDAFKVIESGSQKFLILFLGVFVFVPYLAVLRDYSWC